MRSLLALLVATAACLPQASAIVYTTYRGTDCSDLQVLRKVGGRVLNTCSRDFNPTLDEYVGSLQFTRCDATSFPNGNFTLVSYGSNQKTCTGASTTVTGPANACIAPPGYGTSYKVSCEELPPAQGTEPITVWFTDSQCTQPTWGPEYLAPLNQCVPERDQSSSFSAASKTMCAADGTSVQTYHYNLANCDSTSYMTVDYNPANTCVEFPRNGALSLYKKVLCPNNRGTPPPADFPPEPSSNAVEYQCTSSECAAETCRPVRARKLGQCFPRHVTDAGTGVTSTVYSRIEQCTQDGKHFAQLGQNQFPSDTCALGWADVVALQPASRATCFSRKYIHCPAAVDEAAKLTSLPPIARVGWQGRPCTGGNATYNYAYFYSDTQDCGLKAGSLDYDRITHDATSVTFKRYTGYRDGTCAANPSSTDLWVTDHCYDSSKGAPNGGGLAWVTNLSTNPLFVVNFGPGASANDPDLPLMPLMPPTSSTGASSSPNGLNNPSSSGPNDSSSSGSDPKQPGAGSIGAINGAAASPAASVVAVLLGAALLALVG